MKRRIKLILNPHGICMESDFPLEEYMRQELFLCAHGNDQRTYIPNAKFLNEVMHVQGTNVWTLWIQQTFSDKLTGAVDNHDDIANIIGQWLGKKKCSYTVDFSRENQDYIYTFDISGMFRRISEDNLKAWKEKCQGNTPLVGYKGYTTNNPGIIYAPYIPIQVTHNPQFKSSAKVTATPNANGRYYPPAAMQKAIKEFKFNQKGKSNGQPVL